MKTICGQGFKINSADRKAFEHYLVITPRKWAEGALDGMINKAVKTLMNDWYEIYKSKQEGNVSTDYAVIIPGIIEMDEFKPVYGSTPETPIVDRNELASEEILENGISIEDWEEMALKACYKDPEAMLYWFLENKFFQRRKRFVIEETAKLLGTSEEIPAHDEDFILYVVSKDGYENRSQQEA